ncbi:hypothetical protein ACFV5G_32795 [Streptomyces sp. NPDC059766]|uniref:hypothetical protein n=1 Tax=Streptomyces sp. NPDC059766 TaxID=3346940 RepID=UPI00366A42B1
MSLLLNGRGVRGGWRRPGGKEEHLLDDRLHAFAYDAKGIAIAVWVNTLHQLQRGEPWYEIGVDDPGRRRERNPEPAGR